MSIFKPFRKISATETEEIRLSADSVDNIYTQPQVDNRDENSRDYADMRIGLPTATQFSVGLTVSTAYFNTNVTPDFSIYDWDNPDYIASSDGSKWIYLLTYEDGSSTDKLSIVRSTSNVYYIGRPNVAGNTVYRSTEGWLSSSLSLNSDGVITAVNDLQFVKNGWSNWLTASETVQTVKEYTDDQVSAEATAREQADALKANLTDIITDYNALTNKPILAVDITTATPIANIYYLHTGTTGTYTQGVIYFYDGEEFKAITGGSSGGGGVTDVKIGSTSIVTNGVANIPDASYSKSGVVSTGVQSFKGGKKFDSITVTGTATINTIKTPDKYSVMTLGSYRGFCFKPIFSQDYEITLSATYDPYNHSTYGIAPYRDVSKNATRQVGALNYPFDNLFLKQKLHYNNATNVDYESALPSYDGKLMSMPETWTTGTTPTATLPDSGTYLIVVEDSYTSNIDGETVTKNYNVPVIINWDGETTTISQKWNEYRGTYERYLKIDEQLGQINVLTNEQLSYPLALTIYVKKIGD